MAAAEKKSAWDRFREWLPTLVTVVGIVFAGMAGWLRFEHRIDSNQERITINKAVVKEVKVAQQRVLLEINTFRVQQMQQSRDLARVEKKVDRVLDRMLNGVRRRPGPNR